MNNDLFEEYLEKKDECDLIKKALTDKSYKNYDHTFSGEDTNERLAVLGDAVIKVCFSNILYEKNIKDITKEKEKYESDKNLVSKIAKHYNLLEYILKDFNDPKIPNDYDYEKHGSSKNKNTTKYIAQALRLLLGQFIY